MPLSPPPAPPGRLGFVVTYLEMTDPPALPDPAPDVVLEPPTVMGVGAYRRLFRAVGEAWLWYERLELDDDALAAVLADPGIEVRRLRRAGAVVGFSELDRRDPTDVEVLYLGVVPDAIGAGLGRVLMTETLRVAWRPETARVWLHTCTLDHPGAVAFYEAAGFRRYDDVAVIDDDPRATGTLPPTAGWLCPGGV